MATAFPLLSELSLPSKIPPFGSSHPASSLTALSSLRLLRRPRNLVAVLSSSIPDAIPAVPNPIFLSHLEVSGDDEDEDGDANEEFDEEELIDDAGEEDEGQEDFDPIRSFFKSRAPVPDPKREGRSAWHVADVEPVEIELLDEEEQTLDWDSGVPSGPVEDGVVGEILHIAKNLPQNSTLGDCMDSFAGRIGEAECMELLERMGKDGHAWSCLYLFEWMRFQEPSLVTPRSCSILFPILGRARMGKKLKILFDNLPGDKQFRDVRVYNAAISGLLLCRRYNDTWKVFEAMEANNIQPDHVTCSILVTVMRQSGRSAKDAWQFFERMNRKVVKWSLEVSGALIKTFCDEGLKKEALIIQSEMEKRGIASNVIIYNTLMDAYNKSNQVEEAEGLFKEMKEKGLEPTTVTYNILLDAYSRRMQPEIVEGILLEMQSLGLKPNVKSYTSLIRAYGRQKRMSDKAAECFLRMKAVGIKPTSHSYTALIHAYSISGWHEKAHNAYENMIREGITPSVETYTALLDAFRRAGETKMLMEIWKTMMVNKVEGTRVTFNILLDGLAKHGLYAQARDVVSEFGKMGLQPTLMTYNILMNAYARGEQHCKLPQLLKEMASLNLKPDSITYMTMIYAYVRVRDFTRAFYYHKQMMKSRQVPDGSSYRKLRAILDAKAATKNRRDRGAILGIINSKMGLKPRKGKKDELWKNRKKRAMMKKSSASNLH